MNQHLFISPDEDPLEDAVQAGLRLLVHREHSRLEMYRKLSKRGVDAAVIEDALQRLTDQGALSESRFAEQYVQARVNKGYGPVRIRNELIERGISEALIAANLYESCVDWFSRMAQVSQQKFGSCSASDYKEQAKRARFLEYRGFEHELIREFIWG